jgi:hypothetical protein
MPGSYGIGVSLSVESDVCGENDVYAFTHLSTLGSPPGVWGKCEEYTLPRRQVLSPCANCWHHKPGSHLATMLRAVFCYAPRAREASTDKAASPTEAART